MNKIRRIGHNRQKVAKHMDILQMLRSETKYINIFYNLIGIYWIHTSACFNDMVYNNCNNHTVMDNHYVSRGTC